MILSRVYERFNLHNLVRARERDRIESKVPFKTPKSFEVRTHLFPENTKNGLKNCPPNLKNMLYLMALIFNVNEVDP